MSVDGEIAGEAKLDRIIGIFQGQAFVGRPALDDRTGPRGSGCTIETVTISH